jgi:putative membrane protein
MSFFDERAKKEVAQAVREVEAQTCAELVVAVRHAAGRYRHVDYLAGALLSWAALMMLLFHPRAFAVATMPLDVALVFALGALASSKSPSLRRILSSRRQRNEDVRRAARATFVELGVSRTRSRAGILVYVAMLERAVELVPDVGVEVARLDPRWQDALAALNRALSVEPNLDAFVAALRLLGPPLGQLLPHADDDVNELPDELTAD